MKEGHERRNKCIAAVEDGGTEDPDMGFKWSVTYRGREEGCVGWLEGGD